MAQVFANPFECYEAIGAWLAEAVPEPWEQITVEFTIVEIDDVSEYCIWYRPKRWLAKEGQFFVDHTLFDDCFFQLARLTSTPEKGLFKSCTFVLPSNGKYKADFEYP
ncbi:hypothetical protein ACFFGH_34315 [Lysobacter korlensis]|uniref:Uncharacterized protein n=1 Tax=Lysobacter korlensis TaxID=553636 RepID=A0ABV6S119_9GAMM